MEKMIEVKDLSVRYSSKTRILGKKEARMTAVENVRFDFYKGEVLGIVGESGSGKSTVARCLLNIIMDVDKGAHTEGSIKYNGKELTGIKHKDLKPIRKKIQGIFQDPDSSLNQIYTAGEIIGEPLKYLTDFNKTEREAITKDVMVKCGLSNDDAEKYPSEFSAGQKQRICIARALVTKPEILIADEPLSSLDISIQAQIINLLMDLKEEYGLSIIFITHDLNIVKVLCDRVIVMKDGKIVEQGDTKEVVSCPKNDYTRMLFEANIGIE